jgi:hypothetical protein
VGYDVRKKQSCRSSTATQTLGRVKVFRTIRVEDGSSAVWRVSDAEAAIAAPLPPETIYVL